MRELAIVVTDGPDRGARLAVRAKPRLIGRAREADLMLTDLAVSRRHVEVSIGGRGVVVCPTAGAGKVLVRGAAVERAELGAGETFRIGETTLGVVAEEPADAEHTDVRTLLGGMASDVRGLAALYALSEVLDRVRDRASLDEAVAGWAPSAGASSARLVAPDDESARDLVRQLSARPEQITEVAAEGGGTQVAVPAHGGRGRAFLLLEFAASKRIGDDSRRLLAVAGRICASSVARLEALADVERDNADLRRMAVGSATEFLGSSAAAKHVAAIIPKLAASDAVVLLLGESGTGKTFVARLVHAASARANGPLRIINCAAIPESLLEAELFGHERGAFTGAVAARAGALEAAAGGSILLDEIGELPLSSQAKLLRVLEDRQFERIGSNRPLPLMARVLAATNRDLRAMVNAGTFRSDLFFRISVVSVAVPALRDRPGDLPMLAQRILDDLAPSAGRRVRGFSAQALDALSSYAWPGNVRELRNAIEHALVLGEGDTIGAADLPEFVRADRDAPATPPDMVRLPQKLEVLEQRAIEAALRATGGNRTKAAALLGINRVTLYKKLREEP